MSTPINNIILDRIEFIQLDNLTLLKETFPLLRQLELEVIQRGEQALLNSHQMPCLLIKNISYKKAQHQIVALKT